MEIAGIEKIAEAAALKPQSLRREKDARILTELQDDLTISRTAKAAAMAKSQQKSKAEEIRLEEVERAKQRIQEGTYRVQEIVEYVAERICQLI
ncbi:MAG TPA: flagellar biosynthesis anti-sigma factor FlgM [Candidatus Hydrogenedentes bacterium]|nr:flagellar biosynthesis anti-sigma factor FlgM [Candidatus Hydrogenedentota bacterium]